MIQEKKTYITEDGLNSLKEELEYLKNTKRREIAERIAAAKELGDLSENAEYADAKEEQSFTENRILELEGIIRSAQVIKKSKKNNVIQIGSNIKIQDFSGNTKEYTIVGSNEADPTDGRISNESPLGQAFLGHKVGEEVEVDVPKGKIKFKILKIS